jgi:molybdopterin/thiamine biosynthesis adenylyltransferase
MNAESGCRPWFEDDPQLFEEQSNILKAAGFELDKDALEKTGGVQFRGHSKVDSQRELVVAFPNAFPSRGPKIFDTAASKLLSRHHRIDTRQLCLFGFDENRWNATRSVADALAEAEELISKFKDGNATVENEAPEPLTRAIRYIQGAAMLIPPPLSVFTNFAELKSPFGGFSGKFVHEGEFKQETLGRGIILEANFGATRSLCSLPFSDYFGSRGKEIHGDWFYLQEPPTQENLLEVLNRCLEKSKSLKRTEYYWLALIFNEEVGATGHFRLTWLIARAHANSPGKFHLIRTFPYIQHERYARIPGLEGLEQKRIVLVGCGSLGSKIVTNLAASGVNRFVLIDYDYYEPNNSVRHELGVEWFGVNKERALLNRLCSLNPGVAAKSLHFNFQVGGVSPFAQEQQFYGFVKDADLVIDTAAVHSVSHYLNRLSFETGVPAIFASVTNGAWGGEIVRVMPGKTPCWLCWLDQYYDNKPSSAPTSSSEIFAPGCDQPTFTGTTYDLGIVANLAASMAVETLLNAGTDARFANNYIRWCGKDKDGKPLFLTEMLPTNSQKECWWCGAKHEI